MFPIKFYNGIVLSCSLCSESSFCVSFCCAGGGFVFSLVSLNSYFIHFIYYSSSEILGHNSFMAQASTAIRTKPVSRFFSCHVPLCPAPFFPLSSLFNAFSLLHPNFSLLLAFLLPPSLFQPSFPASFLPSIPTLPSFSFLGLFIQYLDSFLHMLETENSYQKLSLSG